MEPEVFKALEYPREVSRTDLPADLVDFYSKNEGEGLESDTDGTVRLCKLHELEIVGWNNLRFFHGDDYQHWPAFRGIRVGMSMFGDEILYVLDVPCCPPGSIRTMGPDVAGPGGDGEDLLEPSLVLAESFGAWIRHLKECDWQEYGLLPGLLDELPAPQRRIQWQHYKRLNPQLQWEEPA